MSLVELILGTIDKLESELITLKEGGDIIGSSDALVGSLSH